jgi:hypothetical protein
MRLIFVAIEFYRQIVRLAVRVVQTLICAVA